MKKRVKEMETHKNIIYQTNKKITNVKKLCLTFYIFLIEKMSLVRSGIILLGMNYSSQICKELSSKNRRLEVGSGIP